MKPIELQIESLKEEKKRYELILSRCETEYDKRFYNGMIGHLDEQISELMLERTYSV